MAAADISKRNEAERLDWQKRGVSGVLKAKVGNILTLEKRSLGEPFEVTIDITPQTVFRRYAPDSVLFADAQASSVSEIKLGDQVRALGEKIVFGTFVTRAGKITGVDSGLSQVTILDAVSSKPVIVNVKPFSQLKKMPSLAGMGGAPPRPNGPGVPPDITQMIERMPAATLTDLKAGETIVVSSTKGARENEITAIVLLANADMLIQMARSPGPMGQGGAAMGLGTGLGGLDLSGMIP